MKGDVALDIRGLSAGYDGELIIENIDLRVQEGDFLGIIGPNGGGKSTLLKAILGLIEPMKGDIRIYGDPPQKGRRYLGYVPQYTVFDRDFPITVQNVVMMGRRRMKGIRPWYSMSDKDAVKKALTDVGMWEHRRKHIGQLSGGQKQRVYIARALASQPKILLLDEPTASVDAKVEDSIYKLLTELNREMTIVLVTHDIGIISSHVSNVACMNRHIFKGDGKELTEEMLQESYQCPVDLIAHGLPHRVLPPHEKHD
ncbi:MAG: ABC transporter ATP-binding protein [Candidatus Thermoplasmatota archaeon]|nr:ABC transporter ATP-binding protein [Candidatus Thermoplasmatota archaeon]